MEAATFEQSPQGDREPMDRSERSPENSGAFRMLDANLNRCAEALRVVEDICRFHWGFQGSSRELKELRHAVLGLMAAGFEERAALIRHRDIEGDIGKASASPGGPALAERDDGGLPQLALRNLQRAREALRSMEEACRLVRADKVEALEAARYRLYSVEKGVLALVGQSRCGAASRRLCLLVTQAAFGGDEDEVLEGAWRGGVDMIQVREKALSDSQLLARSRRLREWTSRRGILLFINDRPDIARLVSADGVHLGQDDLRPPEARRLLSSAMAIGVSTHSLEQACTAQRDGADYIGVGPVFPSGTKMAGAVLGPEGFRDILSQISVPVFAIGGIGPGNVALLAAAGANRVAVCSSILASRTMSEAEAAARAIRSALETTPQAGVQLL
jgi:thiamine-phosphate pyrophosphorylase